MKGEWVVVVGGGWYERIAVTVRLRRHCKDTFHTLNNEENTKLYYLSRKIVSDILLKALTFNLV